MRLFSSAMLAMVAVTGVSSADAQIVATPFGQAGPVLPANTVVHVSLNSALTSKRTNEGDVFDVTVTRPVIVGDYVVIPQGALGHGRITWRTGKAVFGKSAKMTFELTDLQIGNQSVPLGGRYRLEGKGNTGWTVGSIAAFGVAAGFFVTGHSAEALQGTEYKAFTVSPTRFTLAAPGTAAFYAAGGALPEYIGRGAGAAPYEGGKRAAAAQIAAAGVPGGASPY